MGLIADNRTEQEILVAVLWQIYVKARSLLLKVEEKPILLTGGLCQIKGIDKFASAVLERECSTVANGAYLASIGCAL